MSCDNISNEFFRKARHSASERQDRQHSARPRRQSAECVTPPRQVAANRMLRIETRKEDKELGSAVRGSKVLAAREDREG